jgi:FixJ family two-component response regulator
MNRRTMLIVEDEYYLADDCSRLAEASGFRVIGPYSSVKTAMENLPERLDCALLDINVNGISIYPLVDELISRGVPITLYTGYDYHNIPAKYSELCVVTKAAGCTEAVRSLTRTA